MGIHVYNTQIFGRQKRSKIKQASHVSDFAGAAQSARFSPCLVPLPVFSASSPKQPALMGPPILYSPLHLSLPSLHPASCPLDTPAPQCSHARLPPSPLAVVTWCLNSSSLNSATSTETLLWILSCDFVPHNYETLKWLSSLPVLMQESFWW